MDSRCSAQGPPGRRRASETDSHNFGEYLELLAATGHDFATSLDIGQTIHKALNRIAEYMAAEAASLFLLEEDDRDLRIAGLGLILLPAVAPAAVLRVELDGSGDFQTIQNALDAASAGDEIGVGPGTYTWTNQRVDQDGYGPDHASARFKGMAIFWRFQHENVVLRSSDGPAATILDPEGRGRAFFTEGDNRDDTGLVFTIEGFTVVNGWGPDDNPELEIGQGGAAAIHLASPTLRNCVFRDCSAEEGGAIWLGNSSYTRIEDCGFEDNVSEVAGGAIFAINSNRESTITGCRFEGNASGLYGGAIAVLNDVVTVRNSVFRENRAFNEGATLWARYSKPLRVEDCWLEGNVSPISSVEIDWREPTAAAPVGVERTKVQFHRNMVYGEESRGIRLQEGARLFASCNNVHGCSLGNWSGRSFTFLNQDGNVSRDPLACEDRGDGTEVAANSVLLAANHPACELGIGAAVEGCGSRALPAVESAWRAAFPNPFRPADGGAILEYRLPSSESVTVRIYTLRGALVRELPGTEQQAVWDGLDATGQSVAAGVYVVRAETGDQTAEGRVVLLR